MQTSELPCGQHASATCITLKHGMRAAVQPLPADHMGQAGGSATGRCQSSPNTVHNTRSKGARQASKAQAQSARGSSKRLRHRESESSDYEGVHHACTGHRHLICFARLDDVLIICSTRLRQHSPCRLHGDKQHPDQNVL